MAQPEYSNGSSSTDTDEEWEQDAQTFAMFVQQANASSSIPRSRAPNIDMGWVEANVQLMADYFCDNPTYLDEMFHRSFRMSRHLFIRIMYDLNTRYPYFQQKYDAAGLPNFSPLQKCTAAIRQLAYGISGDAFDDENNVILHVLSMRGSVTYLPFGTPPPPSQHVSIAIVQYVDNNHYIKVVLNGEYPMPTLIHHWTRHRLEEASTWIDSYRRRFDMYEEYIDRVHTSDYMNVGE
ncbi:hypothetical protein OSB04_028753 [Centaurea solstitialis]|uniref:Uncharacterized protein n=1 Tax=Centaurea solstitialis TaxID=347529 RepID=A0AA38SZY0_9ASTR|nr:hypothetical protein OSB04_028753 [Centaurea solstitialis]